MTTFKKFKSAYLVITVTYRVTVRELFSQLNITYLQKKFHQFKKWSTKNCAACLYWKLDSYRNRLLKTIESFTAFLQGKNPRNSIITQYESK